MKHNQKLMELLAPYRDKTREVPKDMPLPVKYDGRAYYWGKDGEMVADFHEGENDGDGFRIRGWGRIQDEERQDECARYIERAINAYSEPTPNTVLIALGSRYTFNGAGQLHEQVAFNPTDHEKVVQRYCDVTIDLTQSPSEYSPEVSEALVKLLSNKS